MQLHDNGCHSQKKCAPGMRRRRREHAAPCPADRSTGAHYSRYILEPFSPEKSINVTYSRLRGHRLNDTVGRVSKKREVARRKNDLQFRFGAVVRDCRRRLGISQEELGWRAGLHRTYITDIERGVRNISLKSVANLSKALEMSMWRLFARASGLTEGSIGAKGKASRTSLSEILMIEDNPVDVELTMRAFKRARFVNPVRVCRDGEEALEYFFGGGGPGKKNKLPQLVLLDLHLPKTDGVEVLRQLKAHELTRSIPVVVLTSSRHDKSILECSRLGVENYIIKPVAFDVLCKVTPQLSLGWALWPEIIAD